MLFAGRIQPLKAPDVLLRAVALLLDETPALRSRLVVPIVGGPSGTGLEHPEALAELADRLGIADVVRFVPPVPPAELARVGRRRVGGRRTVVQRVVRPRRRRGPGRRDARDRRRGRRPDDGRRRRRERAAPRHPRAGRLGLARCGRSCSTTPSGPGSPRVRASAARCSRGRAPPSAPSTSTSAHATRCGSSCERRSRDRRVRDRAQVLRDYLTDNDLEYTEADGVFSFALPGERKLQTPVRLDLGPHALGVHAFVCRNPDENHERVYRWLLERNLKTYAVSYAVDHARRHLPRRPAAALAGHPRGARRAAGLGARPRRRLVQHHPRAGLRLLHPQGVGVAQPARRVHQEPRGVPRLAGNRRDAGRSNAPSLTGVEWPFFDLRIACGEVAAARRDRRRPRPAAGGAPRRPRAGPAAPALPRAGAPTGAGSLVAEIWQHRGTWSPTSWCLDLAVEVDGRVVGVQALEGDEFPLLRTVDSYSWLATEVRGRGLGDGDADRGARPRVRPPRCASRRSRPRRSTTRRRWPSRDASGTPTTASAGPTRRTGVIELQHVRLLAETWRAAGHRVEIEGVEACLPWFGLPAERERRQRQQLPAPPGRPGSAC